MLKSRRERRVTPRVVNVGYVLGVKLRQELLKHIAFQSELTVNASTWSALIGCIEVLLELDVVGSEGIDVCDILQTTCPLDQLQIPSDFVIAQRRIEKTCGPIRIDK
ncbi:hypothetical protein C5Y96_01285 [Blastopirellula marina]|uniref:Uncharacterized protein n=2 Tax=Pirellulales TaxID=2691354 RepID=A0A2S8G8J3_9BACT|nr:hypothetical protein C5Y96_01285 [Blastopirellula marina]RCS56069.1 hypothetical protein DTL36_01285 [Bremerella cremea]